MLETIRKYVEAGMGAVSSKRAEELAKGIAKQGQAGKEQVGKLAHEILDWSKKNGERLVTTIRREVKKQVLAMGVATKAEVESLTKRVAALEGKAKTTKSTASKSTAKKSTAAKRTTAKRTSSK